MKKNILTVFVLCAAMTLLSGCGAMLAIDQVVGAVDSYNDAYRAASGTNPQQTTTTPVANSFSANNSTANTKMGTTTTSTSKVRSSAPAKRRGTTAKKSSTTARKTSTSAKKSGTPAKKTSTSAKTKRVR